MKNICSAIMMGMLLSVLSGCQADAQGPQVWIDQPLDGDIFPLQAITLQSHASDSNGVDSIAFFVNQDSQQVISTGGRRMGQAILAWLPPAAGTYTISARAVDQQGHESALASVTITISGMAAQPSPPTRTTPQQKPTQEQQQAAATTSPQPPLPTSPQVIPPKVVNCRAAPTTDSEVVTWLESGQKADIIGRLSDNSWYLIRHPQSQAECWLLAAIVQVSGSLDTVSIRQAPAGGAKEPAAEQPAQQPPPPPPAADSSPPTISSVSADPGTIYRQGCAGETQTSVLTVAAEDDKGIERVDAAWTLAPLSGSVRLNAVGAKRYQATLGPFNGQGTLEIYGSAVDTAGNWTPFTLKVTVKNCIE